MKRDKRRQVYKKSSGYTKRVFLNSVCYFGARKDIQIDDTFSLLEHAKVYKLIKK